MNKKIENSQQTKWKGIVTVKKPHRKLRKKEDFEKTSTLIPKVLKNQKSKIKKFRKELKKKKEKVYVEEISINIELVKIKKYLKKKGITSVWHFTDRSNLQSIMKHGILSLKKIEKQKIKVELTGADLLSHSLDHYNGLDKYVHLAFMKDHPMYHIAKSRQSIIDPIWIEIDISVLFEKNTLFCDRVANDNTAKLFKLDKIKKKIDFETMLFSPIFDEYKEARKAEILVLEHININKILGVYNGR